MKPIAAFILAGGRSSRMGSDKAFLELAGKPLIARAVELARKVADDVSIVGEQKKLAEYAPLITDIYSTRGPLAGIHAALSNSNSDWNLILAVDLPFLNAAFLKYLLTQAQSSAAIVTVPSTNNYFQPLCAVYRRRFAAAAESALAKGKNKIDALFAGIALRTISEEEMQANQFSAAMFRNLNTPEEWEQAKLEFAPLGR
jgi:molybdenum cofactor guanylyltransferase